MLLRASASWASREEPSALAAIFSSMRVREENCNMVLLAAVTLVSVLVAVIASWWEGPQPSAANPPVYVVHQTAAHHTSVRTVGAPFIPNVNPRDRH
jgi:hypothetical protein